MSFKAHDYRYDFEVCCPYNKKHQMPFSKLWYHLSKTCKDQREKGNFPNINSEPNTTRSVPTIVSI